eukprot:233210-Chlamydomonas_euryale.AAC.9
MAVCACACARINACGPAAASAAPTPPCSTSEHRTSSERRTSTGDSGRVLRGNDGPASTAARATVVRKFESWREGTWAVSDRWHTSSFEVRPHLRTPTPRRCSHDHARVEAGGRMGGGEPAQCSHLRPAGAARLAWCCTARARAWRGAAAGPAGSARCSACQTCRTRLDAAPCLSGVIQVGKKAQALLARL